MSERDNAAPQTDSEQKRAGTPDQRAMSGSAVAAPQSVLKELDRLRELCEAVRYADFPADSDSAYAEIRAKFLRLLAENNALRKALWDRL